MAVLFIVFYVVFRTEEYARQNTLLSAFTLNDSGKLLWATECPIEMETRHDASLKFCFRKQHETPAICLVFIGQEVHAMHFRIM